jgi:hypothetical protein
LHPNQPGAGAAELSFRLELKGHNAFFATLRLPRTAASEVIFAVRLVTEGNKIVADDSRLVGPGESIDWCLGFEPQYGSYNLSISTEMAPGAQSNAFAWATWSATTIRYMV